VVGCQKVLCGRMSESLMYSEEAVRMLAGVCRVSESLMSHVFYCTFVRVVCQKVFMFFTAGACRTSESLVVATTGVESRQKKRKGHEIIGRCV